MIRILLMMLLMATHSVTAFAQHRDIELGYDDVSNPTTILIDSDAFTLDGFLYFESEMELLDPFNPTDFGSDEPGFATNPSEGLLVNSGDQIWLTAVDAAPVLEFRRWVCQLLQSEYGSAGANRSDRRDRQLDFSRRLDPEWRVD